MKPALLLVCLIAMHMSEPASADNDAHLDDCQEKMDDFDIDEVLDGALGSTP